MLGRGKGLMFLAIFPYWSSKLGQTDRQHCHARNTSNVFFLFFFFRGRRLATGACVGSQWQRGLWSNYAESKISPATCRGSWKVGLVCRYWVCTCSRDAHESSDYQCEGFHGWQSFGSKDPKEMVKQINLGSAACSQLVRFLFVEDFLMGTF